MVLGLVHLLLLNIFGPTETRMDPLLLIDLLYQRAEKSHVHLLDAVHDSVAGPLKIRVLQVDQVVAVVDCQDKLVSVYPSYL